MTSGDRPPQPAAPFDPVVLDMTDTDDYGVLTEALYAYAAQMDHAAEQEDYSDRHNDRPDNGPLATRFRDSAARARRMIEDIHRQLDEIAAARRNQ